MALISSQSLESTLGQGMNAMACTTHFGALLSKSIRCNMAPANLSTLIPNPNLF